MNVNAALFQDKSFFDVGIVGRYDSGVVLYVPHLAELIAVRGGNGQLFHSMAKMDFRNE